MTVGGGERDGGEGKGLQFIVHSTAMQKTLEKTGFSAEESFWVPNSSRDHDLRRARCEGLQAASWLRPRDFYACGQVVHGIPASSLPVSQAHIHP
jgi:hypothetical protein